MLSSLNVLIVRIINILLTLAPNKGKKNNYLVGEVRCSFYQLLTVRTARFLRCPLALTVGAASFPVFLLKLLVA